MTLPIRPRHKEHTMKLRTNVKAGDAPLELWVPTMTDTQYDEDTEPAGI